MFTDHGYHIPGTENLGVELPLDQVEPCGGPDVCGTCRDQAACASVAKEVEFHYAVAVAELFEALRHEITTNYSISRERSFVVTNLEQAELWLSKCEVAKPVISGDPGYLARAARSG